MPLKLFDRMVAQSQELDQMIDFDLCLGFQASYGPDKQQAVQNQGLNDRARTIAYQFFAELDSVDCLLSPINEPGFLNAFLKGQEELQKHPLMLDITEEETCPHLWEYLQNS